MEAEASSRDLLQRFAGSTTLSDVPPPAAQPPPPATVEDIELSLSLGGCFSTEPREKKRIFRSSSISTFSFFSAADENFPSLPPVLARTCSLPVEGEDEVRKRKELQSLRRLEAKRKRLERRNVSVKSEDFGGCPIIPGGLPASSSHAARPPIGSQGSSSFSAASDFDCHQIQGISNCSEEKSLSTPDRPNHKIENALKSGLRGSRTGTGEMEKSMMEEMPCVSTRGGANGRRIEGFLYKYNKGEEVRIVCVCHGRFLTPAEFVRHAGGGDVDHPLRHIVVNPSPSAYV